MLPLPPGEGGGEGRLPSPSGRGAGGEGRRKRFRPPTLRILDPACGSGSFLIVAYQYLLDWYLKQYTEVDKPAKHARGAHPRVYQTDTGDWRLTTAERKRILLAHIYGVDIDYQACEVTKLSLLLKVLEGETEATLQRQLFEKARALPDLANNIKCGNSLIGPDFYTGRQREMFDEDEVLRINAFDWHKEFPQVFPSPSGRGQGEGRGGFDAVIGNPPYIRMEAFKELKEYLRQRYEVHDERTDLYAYFIEREHELLREGGAFGMIVSNKFLRANYGRKVRTMLSRVGRVERIVDLAGLPVFKGATVRTIVLITRRTGQTASAVYSPPVHVDAFRSVEAGTVSLDDAVRPLAYSVAATAFKKPDWNLAEPRIAALMETMQHGAGRLSDFVEGQVCRGIVSGLTTAFVISADERRSILRSNPRAKDIIFPFVQGRSIRRYSLEPSAEYLIYTPHGIDMTPYPAVIEHLRPFRKKLEKRATKQQWYELQQPQAAYKDWFQAPKIIFPDIATGCRFTLDQNGHFGANTVYFIPVDNVVLLGILNSRAAEFFFKQVCAALEGPGEAYLRFFGQYLEGFPVRLPEAKKDHDRMVNLVQRMLDLNKRLREVKTDHDRNAIQRRIEATDREIDQLVYELYGLSDKEIALVEEAAKKA